MVFTFFKICERFKDFFLKGENKECGTDPVWPAKVGLSLVLYRESLSALVCIAVVLAVEGRWGELSSSEELLRFEQ